MRLSGKLAGFAAAFAVAAIVGCSQLAADRQTASSAALDPLARKDGEWVTWGGDPGNTRYSPLDQINASNVGQMEVAWRWKASDIAGRPGSQLEGDAARRRRRHVRARTAAPASPPSIPAQAPRSGPTSPIPIARKARAPFSGSSRAVSYWTDGKAKRILHNTIDGRLLSIDAVTGKADPDLRRQRTGRPQAGAAAAGRHAHSRRT